MRARTLLICIIAVASAGCATVTRGTIDTWVVESIPPGAEVTLSNGMSCTTPCSLQVKRKHGFTAEIRKEGFEPVMATIMPKQSTAGSAGMAGNVFLAVVPAGVDLSSGAMKDLVPNPLVVELHPQPDSDEFDTRGGVAAESGYYDDDELEMGVIKRIKTRTYD